MSGDGGGAGSGAVFDEDDRFNELGRGWLVRFLVPGHLTSYLTGAGHGGGSPYHHRFDEGAGDLAQGDPRPTALERWDPPDRGAYGGWSAFEAGDDGLPADATGGGVRLPSRRGQAEVGRANGCGHRRGGQAALRARPILMLSSAI